MIRHGSLSWYQHVTVSISWLRSEIALFTFFWIWIVTLVFFVQGIDTRAGNVNIFKIFDMTLALLFIVSFQFSRALWLFIIIRFCFAIIIYAIIVCLLHVLFHFRNFGLNEPWWQDIGLLIAQMGKLLSFLLIEVLTIIMLVILLILLRKTAPITKLRSRFLETIFEVLDTFFDITKLTVFGIMLACFLQVSAINFILLTVADFSMIVHRIFRFVVLLTISLCAAFVLLTRMLFQLHYFGENEVISCKTNVSVLTLDINTWFGIGKLNPKEHLTTNCLSLIRNAFILATVTVYSILIEQNNKSFSQLGWNGEHMFKDSVFLNSNKNLLSFIKYLFKYGFYCFGIELTCIFIALLINNRSDFWALVYSSWLVLFVIALNSAFMPAIWNFFKYFLIVVIPLQYAAVLGLFFEECFGSHLVPNTVLSRIFRWLYLPMGNWKPDSIILFWDSIVLLFALCQANAFEFEKRYGRVQIAKMSNSHKIFFDTDPMVYRKTTFGLVRYVTFCLLPNLATIWFYLAATEIINIYAVFYGICFTVILVNNDSYFTTSSGRPKKLWKRLLIANVLIILLKTSMQIPGCVFQGDIIKPKYHWLKIIFGISCFKLNRDARSHQFLTWDIICFITMMFHDRFLRSPFYVGMAIEAELTKKFSFKAAKILEELHEKELAVTRERYRRNLKKIRVNMKRLREAQKRTGGSKLHEPKTHQEAVTSGDYYLFKDSMSKEIELCNFENENEFDAEYEDRNEVFREVNPSIETLIKTALKSDMEKAVKLAEATLNSPCLRNSKLKTSRKTTSFIESSFVDEKSTTQILPTFKKTVLNKEKSSSSSLSEKSTGNFSPFFNSTGPARVSTYYADETEKKKMKNYKKSLRDSFGLQNKRRLSRKMSSRSLPPKDTLFISTPSKPRSKSVDDSTSIKPPGIAASVHKDFQRDSCMCDTPRSKRQSSLYFQLVTLFKFLRACVHSFMISLTQFFNELARDHKYVMRQLEEAKQAQRGEMVPKLSTSSLVIDPRKDFSAFVNLLLSTHDLIMSRFNCVCFFFVLLAQIRNPTVYVLPLTLMVLFWGSLSVPRPSKLFWKSIFTYTVVLIIFDCVMRSALVDNNSSLVASNNTLKINPFFTVEKQKNFSIYYLFILLAVLWQRSMLMNLGLWDVDESLSPMTWKGNLIRKPWLWMKDFFLQLCYYTGDKIPVDVYTFIFFCDFVNIFIFIFGFASMTEREEEGVSRYFFENKVPPALLLLFCVQCVAIFLDRWIYLRRNIKAKILFFYAQIIVVHINLFIILQGLTLSRMNTMFFPTLWYSVKFTYFILSAYQIRNGYPSSVYGHALCQSYSIINLYLYQGYLFLPFVYELRTITDWLWTETTLTMTEWLGMEDIFCTVFVIKCWRNYDDKYSYQRGFKISKTVKLVEGGILVIVFFFVLLFPLAFFAFGHVTGKQNIPDDMELSFRLGSLSPIYVGYSEEIRSFTLSQWLNFQTLYEHSPAAFTFLSEYSNDDVGLVRFANFSVQDWIVPPIAIQQIIQLLREDQEGGRPYKLQMAAEWKLNRQTEDHKRQTLVSGRKTVILNQDQKRDLLKVFLQNSSRFIVNHLAPKFLKVGSFSNAAPIEMLTLESEHGEHIVISPFMTTAFEIDRNGSNLWWMATEYYESSYGGAKLIDEDNPNSDLIIYTFNDKIFPTGLISYVSAQGILGLYTTFLVTIGYVIRRTCRGRVNQVFLDYIPNVDCVLQLLLDIYFVRENGDARLEEDLYSKLIFLFRSPETLIQWTRQRKRREEGSTLSYS